MGGSTNGHKNGLNRGNEETQFTSDNQPSSEAKSRGWQRRRLAQEFMDKVFELQEMSIDEFEKMELDMAKNKAFYKIGDLMALKYISKMVDSEKLLLDWLDRHLGKPPKYDESEDRDKITKYKIEIVNTHKAFDENGNIVDVPFEENLPEM